MKWNEMKKKEKKEGTTVRKNEQKNDTSANNIVGCWNNCYFTILM